VQQSDGAGGDRGDSGRVAAAIQHRAEQRAAGAQFLAQVGPLGLVRQCRFQDRDPGIEGLEVGVLEEYGFDDCGCRLRREHALAALAGEPVGALEQRACGDRVLARMCRARPVQQPGVVVADGKRQQREPPHRQAQAALVQQPRNRNAHQPHRVVPLARLQIQLDRILDAVGALQRARGLQGDLSQSLLAQRAHRVLAQERAEQRVELVDGLVWFAVVRAQRSCPPLHEQLPPRKALQDSCAVAASADLVGDVRCDLRQHREPHQRGLDLGRGVREHLLREVIEQRLARTGVLGRGEARTAARVLGEQPQTGSPAVRLLPQRVDRLRILDAGQLRHPARFLLRETQRRCIHDHHRLADGELRESLRGMLAAQDDDVDPTRDLTGRRAQHLDDGGGRLRVLQVVHHQNCRWTQTSEQFAEIATGKAAQVGEELHIEGRERRRVATVLRAALI
jgi:hypothetical protein